MGDQLRTGEVTNAADSVVEYALACDQRDQGDDAGWKQALASIADYNAYDCLSTLRLCAWLRQRAAEHGISWDTPADLADPTADPAADRRTTRPRIRIRWRPPCSPSPATRPEASARPTSRPTRCSPPRSATTAGRTSRSGGPTSTGSSAPVDEWANTRDVFLVESATVLTDWDTPPRKRRPAAHPAAHRRLGPGQHRRGRVDARGARPAAAGRAQATRAGHPRGLPRRGDRAVGWTGRARGRHLRGAAAQERGPLRLTADGPDPRAGPAHHLPRAGAARHRSAGPRLGPGSTARARRAPQGPAPHPRRWASAGRGRSQRHHRRHHRGRRRPRPLLRRRAGPTRHGQDLRRRPRGEEPRPARLASRRGGPVARRRRTLPRRRGRRGPARAAGRQAAQAHRRPAVDRPAQGRRTSPTSSPTMATAASSVAPRGTSPTSTGSGGASSTCSSSTKPASSPSRTPSPCRSPRNGCCCSATRSSCRRSARAPTPNPSTSLRSAG